MSRSGVKRPTIRQAATRALLVLGCVAWLATGAAAVGVGNIDENDRYVWSENSRWLNFRPTHGGVTVHGTYLDGYVWSEGAGWIKLGTDGGGPYANTSATDWGVNHDGAGNLSGYGWSETAGWVNFNPTHGQVTISTFDGDFDGFAWSENLGWIHFKRTIFPQYGLTALGCPIVGGDNDGDGDVDCVDLDDDNDGVPDNMDTDVFDPTRCADADGDLCDDCTNGVDGFGVLPDYDPSNDGLDIPDADGLCNEGDPDDDNDGVLDGPDPQQLNPEVCGDADGDLCDDCAIGTDGIGPLPDNDPDNDGDDFEGDGLCDFGDPDDDNDGALDPDDSDDFNPNVCSDADGDTCEDCTNGTFDLLNDGYDYDTDGLCDLGDPDDDNDGAADPDDSDDNNANICNDSDADTCDDCTGGSDDPSNDGTDLPDVDGLCNAGDPDDDNDGVEDGSDDNPFDPDICTDDDGDTCDDCSVGTDDLGPEPDNNPNDDGPDNDEDGLCDDGDDDDDNDGVLDIDDGCPFDPDKSDPGVCGCFAPDDDGDLDTFVDCIDNCPEIPNDQTDSDLDETGDACDCADGDPDLWRVPGPITTLMLSHTGGEFGTTTMEWSAPAETGASPSIPLSYDMLLSSSATGFLSGVCVETDDGDLVAVDNTPAILPLFFVVRAQHTCGEGSGGMLQDGGDRDVSSCP